MVQGRSWRFKGPFHHLLKEMPLPVVPPSVLLVGGGGECDLPGLVDLRTGRKCCNSRKMNRPRLRVLAAVGVAVLVVLMVWLYRPQPRPDAGTTRIAGSPSLVPSNVVSSSTSKADKPQTLFHAALKGVRDARDSAGAQLSLADLRRALAAMPAAAASVAIHEFLDSKADASTHQAFKVGGKGALTEAPSLRTFLLDYLGQIDPAAAAAYARLILSTPDSPDEWAVSLRNLAQGDPSSAGRALLEQKTDELLRNEAWQQEPSAGYLEAFDVAVFLGGTNLAPALGDLVRRQDNPTVAHAAYLALDRLVINDPAVLLAALQAAPELMQGREATRADFFARADVRDPQQRQVLESYLVDPQRSPAELAQFAGVFPNANYMISQNLLTPTPTPDHAALLSRDTASLQVVQVWLADARFANLQQPLLKVQQRLQAFARRGPQFPPTSARRGINIAAATYP